MRVVIDGNAEQFLQALPVAAERVTLDFSNRSLPERFTVTLADDGQGWGEWLAVALKGKAEQPRIKTEHAAGLSGSIFCPLRATQING